MLPKAVGVIIPAHNEEVELPDCLDTVQLASCEYASYIYPSLEIRVIVVADACTDTTVQQVFERNTVLHTVELISVDFCNVGRARGVGAQKLIANFNDEDLSQVWIAITDADTQVPVQWLYTQLQHAKAGVDCLVGTVEPRPDSATQELLCKWHARHVLTEDHPHIFGANLGIRASWYEKVGGFLPLPTGEDINLVDKIRRSGAWVVSTDTTRVATSARFSDRVTQGFSSYCHSL